MPLVAPTKLIMDMPISNYQWHEFFPNGNLLNYFLFFTLLLALSLASNYKLTFGTDVATHNIGVVIAIWSPIVLVGEPVKNLFE